MAIRRSNRAGQRARRVPLKPRFTKFVCCVAFPGAQISRGSVAPGASSTCIAIKPRNPENFLEPVTLREPTPKRIEAAGRFLFHTGWAKQTPKVLGKCPRAKRGNIFRSRWVHFLHRGALPRGPSERTAVLTVSSKDRSTPGPGPSFAETSLELGQRLWVTSREPPLFANSNCPRGRAGTLTVSQTLKK